jgi:hypothetical protein
MYIEAFFPQVYYFANMNGLLVISHDVLSLYSAFV